MTSVPTAGAAKQTGRALLAVGLVLGVYMLALGIVFAWGYTIYLIVAYGTITNSVAQFALLGLIVAIAIGRGVSVSIRPHHNVPEESPSPQSSSPVSGKPYGIFPTR